MAAPSPSSALASSEFSATAFSPKETQKQKARTIKQRYRLSAFSHHDRHPFASQVFGTQHTVNCLVVQGDAWAFARTRRFLPTASADQRESFFQPLEMIDDIPCENLFFLFFATHGNIRLFSKCRTSPQVRAAYLLFSQATAANSTALLPSGVPRLTINQNRPRLPQNLPCQQTEPDRNMAAPSPSSAFASS